MRHYLELFSGMQNLLRKKAHYLKSDCSKAHSLLGWQPQWSIGKTIEKITAWHKAHLAGENMQAYTVNEINAYTATVN